MARLFDRDYQVENNYHQKAIAGIEFEKILYLAQQTDFRQKGLDQTGGCDLDRHGQEISIA